MTSHEFYIPIVEYYSVGYSEINILLFSYINFSQVKKLLYICSYMSE